MMHAATLHVLLLLQPSPVAAALLRPRCRRSRQSPPPDTPEHSAALNELMLQMHVLLRREMALSSVCSEQPHSRSEAADLGARRLEFGLATQAADLTVQLQHAPPPDVLLERLCQLAEQQGSSDGSGSAAQQADAELWRLMAARRPAVELCASCAAPASSAPASAVSIEALAVHVRQVADRAVPAGSSAAQHDSNCNGSNSSSPCMSLQLLLLQAFQQAVELAGESSSDADQEQPERQLLSVPMLCGGVTPCCHSDARASRLPAAGTDLIK